MLGYSKEIIKWHICSFIRLLDRGDAQKDYKTNRLDTTSKRRGRRKCSKAENDSPSRNANNTTPIKKRQIIESEKVKRGQQRDLPLSNLEQDLSHPDRHLSPTEKSPHDLVLFSSELVSELQQQVSVIKLPSFLSIKFTIHVCIVSSIEGNFFILI